MSWRKLNISEFQTVPLLGAFIATYIETKWPGQSEIHKNAFRFGFYHAFVLFLVFDVILNLFF